MAADRTRTAIITAAERLYAERGFADVTMRDIVAAADVNYDSYLDLVTADVVTVESRSDS